MYVCAWTGVHSETRWAESSRGPFGRRFSGWGSLGRLTRRTIALCCAGCVLAPAVVVGLGRMCLDRFFFRTRLGCASGRPGAFRRSVALESLVSKREGSLVSRHEFIVPIFEVRVSRSWSGLDF